MIRREPHGARASSYSSRLISDFARARLSSSSRSRRSRSARSPASAGASPSADARSSPPRHLLAALLQLRLGAPQRGAVGLAALDRLGDRRGARGRPRAPSPRPAGWRSRAARRSSPISASCAAAQRLELVLGLDAQLLLGVLALLGRAQPALGVGELGLELVALVATPAEPLLEVRQLGRPASRSALGGLGAPRQASPRRARRAARAARRARRGR